MPSIPHRSSSPMILCSGSVSPRSLRPVDPVGEYGCWLNQVSPLPACKDHGKGAVNSLLLITRSVTFRTLSAFPPDSAGFRGVHSEADGPTKFPSYSVMSYGLEMGVRLALREDTVGGA